MTAQAHGEREVVLLGAGGHARVVADAWCAAGGGPIAGVVVEDGHGDAAWRPSGRSWRRGDSWLIAQDPARFLLLLGVGLVPGRRARLELAARYLAAGFRFATVRHPAAILAEDAVLEEGAQVMAGAVLQTGVRVGPDAVVNTGAIVDHDCVIGAAAHIAPGAVLCGAARVGEAAFVGAGAVVLPATAIGAGALVPAGCVVRADVPAGARATLGGG